MFLQRFRRPFRSSHRWECCYDLTGNLSGVCPECGADVRCRQQSQCASSVMVRLRSRSWLRRVLDVSTPQGVYVVEYNGRGLGFETVYVNGHVAARQRGRVWFVPQFTFSLGGQTAVLDVRIWPWITLRMMSLRVDGALVYRDE